VPCECRVNRFEALRLWELYVNFESPGRPGLSRATSSREFAPSLSLNLPLVASHVGLIAWPVGVTASAAWFEPQHMRVSRAQASWFGAPSSGWVAWRYLSRSRPRARKVNA
jgi:hypothetical protein